MLLLHCTVIIISKIIPVIMLIPVLRLILWYQWHGNNKDKGSNENDNEDDDNDDAQPSLTVLKGLVSFHKKTTSKEPKCWLSMTREVPVPVAG